MIFHASMQFITKIDTPLLNLLEIYTNLIPWPHFGASGTHFGASRPHFGASWLHFGPSGSSREVPGGIRGSPGTLQGLLGTAWGLHFGALETLQRGTLEKHKFWTHFGSQNGVKMDPKWYILGSIFEAFFEAQQIIKFYIFIRKYVLEK